MTPRALVMGEALVDIIDGEAFPGGSPLNVAVGLSRLGVPTELACRFGDDAHGDVVAEHLTESGVSFAPGVPGANTSTAEVVLDSAQQPTYRFELDSQLPAPSLDGVALVHTGSLGAVLGAGAEKVLSAFEDHGERLRSYDPNIRPQLMRDHGATLAAVERLARRSHIVKLSDEDAEWLYPGVGPDAVLTHVLSLGAEIAVLTRGAEGCLARTAALALAVPAEPITVADTVGAGDSFMAALLAATFNGPLGAALLGGTPVHAGDLESALLFATRAAGITSSRVGANPPWSPELSRALAMPLVDSDDSSQSFSASS